MKVAVRDAKSKLSMFGDMAHNGETIVICKHGKPWFNLVPHATTKRKTTALKGVSPLITESDAIAPVTQEDVPGWI